MFLGWLVRNFVHSRACKKCKTVKTGGGGKCRVTLIIDKGAVGR